MQQIDSDLLKLGFKKTGAKGVRLYTLDTVIIDPFFVQFSVGFDGKNYTIKGHASSGESQLFNDTVYADKKIFDATLRAVKSNMMTYYHKRVEAVIDRACTSFSDYSGLCGMIAAEQELPQGYNAEVIDCYLVKSGKWRTVFEVKRGLKATTKTYYLYIDLDTESALGSYKVRHYSAQILDALVNYYGWKHSTKGLSVSKNLGGVQYKGQLNPTGVLLVTASFDSSGRYLTLQHGFDDAFDLDCRGLEIKAAAKLFDAKTTAWVNGPTKATVIEASNGTELFEKFKELSKIGVDLPNYGKLYPIVSSASNGYFRYTTRLEKRVGGDWDRATSDQENNVMYEFDHNMIRIELRDPNDLYEVVGTLYAGKGYW